MAIAKIKKIEVIGLEKDKGQLLSLLQKLGKVELISIRAKDAVASTPAVYPETSLLEIEEAISYLASFKEEAGLLESLVKFKPVIYEKQLQELMSSVDYKNILHELSGLRNRLKNISQHKEKLIQEKQLLFPWQRLRLSLEELHAQQHCGIILGALNRRDYLKLSEEIEENKFNLFMEVVHQDRPVVYLALLYLREEFEKLEVVLKSYHFNFITLTRHQCTAEERLFEINREILVLDDQLNDVKNNIFELAEQQFKLMVVYDYLYNTRKTREVDKNLAKQQFTFSLSGWIKDKEIKALEKALSDSFKDIAIFISEPTPGENIPVVLENKRLVQPFEFITSIYGMPKYNEIDPTPYLAPFFFVYFGFCVSDVGYGIMLILLSWFVLKKFKMGPQGQKFFRLFLFCGISTVIVGALMGSWFGNLFDLLAEGNKMFLPLKNFKDALVILDPLKEPTKLLGIALSLGIFQVWFGNILAAIGNIKNKRYLDIVFDQIPMLLFLFGLTGLGLIFLHLLNTTPANLFKYSAFIGAAGLILTQGRAEKGIGAKLFYGAYNLYSALSGYLSDILSYSRLWALGLVTGVMASTINLISVQFSQIFFSVLPFMNKTGPLKVLVSSLILIVIFVFGHIVSFLMNLLGAFVHPLRLQFVEFFSKFFKSGGSVLRPFKIETKYINLE